jgi:hypothetical protein
MLHGVAQATSGIRWGVPEITGDDVPDSRCAPEARTAQPGGPRQGATRVYNGTEVRS